MTKDKSAYWTPLLHYEHPNGSFEEVSHSGSVVFYLTRGPGEDNLTPFPKGFQMLSGNKANRAYNQSGMTWGNSTYPPRPISEAVIFACLSENIGPDRYGMENITSCINGMRAQTHFQTCWNGLDLYKSDNSHVAHLSSIDHGICPPGYPYQFPHLFLETNYQVEQVSNNSDGGRYIFSMGDPTGYGFHGDFQNGWDENVLVEAIETCLINNAGPDGTIEECPILLENDSVVAGLNCPERPPQIDEAVHGMLSKLPGCVNVTPGPQAATAADLECPASVAQPVISTTIVSTPLITATPAIGQAYGNPNNVYLGCGNDTYGSSMRAVNAYVIENEVMTVELYQSHCTAKGYRVSGVEYGTQCFCDLTVNPTSQLSGYYSLREGCDMTCNGNRSEFCGGPFHMNIYDNTDTNFNTTTGLANSVISLTIPPAPYAGNYAGCASEGITSRALNAAYYSASNMTLKWCQTQCQNNDYQYYGLETQTDCYCGNELASGSQLLDTLTTPLAGSNCNERCAGNFSQVCGGPYCLSVYNNTAYVPVVITKIVGRYFTKGCLTDSTSRRSLTGSFSTAPDMTPQECVKICLGGRFHYAGIEFGNQCFCGNSITAGAVSESCDVDALFHCPDNKYTYCGAGNLLNLYYSATL